MICVVTDETSKSPVLGTADIGAESGRGLQVVHALAAAWGWVVLGAREKAVWAALLLPDRVPAASVSDRSEVLTCSRNGSRIGITNSELLWDQSGWRDSNQRPPAPGWLSDCAGWLPLWLPNLAPVQVHRGRVARIRSGPPGQR